MLHSPRARHGAKQGPQEGPSVLQAHRGLLRAQSWARPLLWRSLQAWHQCRLCAPGAGGTGHGCLRGAGVGPQQDGGPDVPSDVEPRTLGLEQQCLVPRTWHVALGFTFPIQTSIRPLSRQQSSSRQCHLSAHGPRDGSLGGQEGGALRSTPEAQAQRKPCQAPGDGAGACSLPGPVPPQSLCHCDLICKVRNWNGPSWGLQACNSECPGGAGAESPGYCA